MWVAYIMITYNNGFFLGGEYFQRGSTISKYNPIFLRESFIDIYTSIDLKAMHEYIRINAGKYNNPIITLFLETQLSYLIKAALASYGS